MQNTNYPIANASQYVEVLETVLWELQKYSALCEGMLTDNIEGQSSYTEIADMSQRWLGDIVHINSAIVEFNQTKDLSMLRHKIEGQDTFVRDQFHSTINLVDDIKAYSVA